MLSAENTVNNQLETDKMTLVRWRAPGRLFKKRDRLFFQTVIALVFLIGLILFLIKEFLLIGVVLALTFVTYVLTTVPPEEIEHQIKVKGFESAGLFTPWEDLSEFWFEEKWGQKLLVLQKKNSATFPSRIIVLLGNQDPHLIKEKINEYLPFREKPEKNWVDDVANWLHQHLPFEKT